MDFKEAGASTFFLVGCHRTNLYLKQTLPTEYKLCNALWRQIEMIVAYILWNQIRKSEYRTDSIYQIGISEYRITNNDCQKGTYLQLS